MRVTPGFILLRRDSHSTDFQGVLFVQHLEIMLLSRQELRDISPSSH